MLRPNGNVKVTVLVVVGIAITVLILTSSKVLDATRQKPRVEITFKAFSQALIDRRLNDAYALCSPEFRQATALDEFTRIQNLLVENHGQLQSVDRGSLELKVRNSSPMRVAIVRPTFHYARNPEQFVVELREENGEWYVWAFKQL